MEQDVAKTSPLTVADQAQVSPKQHALEQLSKSATGDGSVFQQLASNPFFTAVSAFESMLKAVISKSDRDLDSQVWARSYASHSKV